MDKPREIDSKIGRIRPAARETYDMRAATALPSATGGRPSTSAPLEAAVGTDITTPTVAAPTPLGDVTTLIQNGKLRYAQKPQGILGTIGTLNRSIEEYTINNADMVNVTAAYIERVAASDPAVLDGFSDAHEAAQWAVAQIQRNFEPGPSPRMVDLIHQSRTGRQVYQFLRAIEEASNGEV